VARDDARHELESLRRTLRAWVATVPDAKDVSGSPGLGSSSSLGVTGVMGHPGVAEAIRNSSVCLLIGTRLSVTARTGLDDALASVRTLSLGSAAPYLPCTHVHTGDLRASLAQLNRTLTGSGRPRGVRVLGPTIRTELQPPTYHGDGIRYREALDVLDAALPDGVDVVVDAGNTGASAVHHLPVRRSGRFAVALGMGGMGYSFGAGIGMAFARAINHPRQGRAPSPRTVIVAGDGAFFMHGLEMHTAIQYQLPVTLVLFNNNAHAMCVTREQLLYEDRYSYNRFTPSRLGAGLAAMFPGLLSVDVTDIGALPGAVGAALEVDGPSVVSIECSADEIPPFAPFLGQTLRGVSAPQVNSTQHNEEHSHVAARA
jgi:acetolactate synthase-1/2/3 large subunit